MHQKHVPTAQQTARTESAHKRRLANTTLARLVVWSLRQKPTRQNTTLLTQGGAHHNVFRKINR